MPAYFPIRISSLLTVELGLMEKKFFMCPLYLRKSFHAFPSNSNVNGSLTSAPVFIVLKIIQGFLSMKTKFLSERLEKSE